MQTKHVLNKPTVDLIMTVFSKHDVYVTLQHFAAVLLNSIILVSLRYYNI